MVTGSLACSFLDSSKNNLIHVTQIFQIRAKYKVHLSQCYLIKNYGFITREAEITKNMPRAFKINEMSRNL